MELPEAAAKEYQRKNYGKNTDARLKRAAAALRAVHVPVAQVAKWLCISPNAVLEAERENSDEVVTIKEKTAQRWEIVQLMCSEELIKRLQEEPDKVKFSELGLTGGIAGTKALEARGEATAIVEHRQAISVDDVLAKMKAAGSAIDVQTSVSDGVSAVSGGSLGAGCSAGRVPGDLEHQKAADPASFSDLSNSAKGAGGGCAVSTGVGHVDGLASENLNTNGSDRDDD